jgi:hypothetical protein
LLVAVASVRDLGFNTHDSDEEGDDWLRMSFRFLLFLGRGHNNRLVI